MDMDHPNAMERGAWDYGYSLAAEYFPGLERKDFYAFAVNYALAIMEWEDMVGAGEPNAKGVERFYREGFGLLFHLLRNPRPPGVWDADIDRANVTRQWLQVGGARSILDFGGGAGGCAMQLARWGYQVGFVDAGETARFADWWIKREGMNAPRWLPWPGKVAPYYDLADAVLGAKVAGQQWHAIAALDVLEHLWEPVDLLNAFYDALAPGGVLVLTRHSFKKHPTHLARTFWLFEEADRVLAEIGFTSLTPPDGAYGIASWRKAGELPPLPAPPATDADGGAAETDAPLS